MTKNQALHVAFWVAGISFFQSILFQGLQLFVDPAGSSTFGIEGLSLLAIQMIVLGFVYKRFITVDVRHLPLCALGFVLSQLPLAVMTISWWIESIRLAFVIKSIDTMTYLFSINHAMPFLTLLVLTLLVIYAYSKRDQLLQQDIRALYSAGLILGITFALAYMILNIFVLFVGNAMETSHYSLSTALKVLFGTLTQNLIAIALVPMLGKAFGLNSFKLKLSSIRYLVGFYLLINGVLQSSSVALSLIWQVVTQLTQNELVVPSSNFSLFDVLIFSVYIGVGYLLVRKPEPEPEAVTGV